MSESRGGISSSGMSPVQAEGFPREQDAGRWLQACQLELPCTQPEWPQPRYFVLLHSCHASCSCFALIQTCALVAFQSCIPAITEGRGHT